jgi:FtsH-binding integral membrane protein
MCLAGFTLCQSLLVGTIASTYSPDIVVKAVVATAAITLGLTLFAFQTRIDFTAMSSSMFCLLIVLLLFGVWVAIFPSQIAQTAYAALGAFVFSLFIVYDTQLIIGGKHHTHQFSVDEYVFAALTIYIDIIQLFLFMLRLFGNRD